MRAWPYRRKSARCWMQLYPRPGEIDSTDWLARKSIILLPLRITRLSILRVNHLAVLDRHFHELLFEVELVLGVSGQWHHGNEVHKMQSRIIASSSFARYNRCLKSTWKCTAFIDITCERISALCSDNDNNNITCAWETRPGAVNMCSVSSCN